MNITLKSVHPMEGSEHILTYLVMTTKLNNNQSIAIIQSEDLVELRDVLTKYINYYNLSKGQL